MTHNIPSIDDFLSRDSSRLADSVFGPCPLCGRMHPTPFQTIHMRRGATAEIPGLAENILGHKPRRAVVIYDQAIEQVVAAMLFDPLRQMGMAVEPFAMSGEPGHLLDSGLENGNAAAEKIGLSADILIGAGSGVICDLTKWIATRLSKPFILCGTAPSMNGYTSITATITQNGVKISEFLNPANAVVMDVDIIKNAPMSMIHAGIGDLSARAICNADWKMAQFLKGSYFCSLPYQMTAANEARYLAAATEIAARDPLAVEELIEAILLSGLSMTILEGETSPSSGAEHVISHFWDFLVHTCGAAKNFHGAQVRVGTVIMQTLYQYLRELDPAKIDPQAVLRSRPSLEEIEAENRRLYGEKANSFNLVARKKFIPEADYLDYTRGVLNRWDELFDALDPYIAPVDRIRRPFELAGVPFSLSSIHRTREQAREALLHGSHYRPRYTALDFMWEMGLFPQAADEILDRAGID